LMSRIAPILALKGKLTQKDTGGLLTRKVLVVTQFVISIVLIIGAIIINKQIKYAIDSDLGYEKSGVVMVTLPSSLDKVQLKSLKNRIMQFPGIEGITACYASPGAGDSQWGTSIQYNNRPEDETFSIQTKIADEDYLNTFDLKLVAGRNFYTKDSVYEIVVNTMLTKKLGVESPDKLLGKSIKVAGGMVNGTIVGVIEDFHDRDFHETVNPVYIAPVIKNYQELAIKLNTNNIKASLDHIENQWSGYFPDFIFEYGFLEERVSELYQSEQQFLSLTRLFSSLAIFIGCLDRKSVV